MISIRLSLILSLSYLLGPILSLTAQDSTPPVLQDFRISPTVVDVTNGPVDVQLEFDITDDVSGLRLASYDIEFDRTLVRTGFSTGDLVAGNVLNGTYRTTLTIPQTSPPGERAFRVLLTDDVNNTGFFEPEATFDVINRGTFDQEKPVIESITIEPRVVDLSEGPVTVNFTIKVSDDLSGVRWLLTDVKPVNPDAAPRDWTYREYESLTEGSETGTVEFSFGFSEFTEAGEWQLEIISMGDGVMRVSEYSNQTKLREDFDPTFTIVNPNGDGTPPELVSLEFDETEANTAFETSFLPWSVQFSDDISGIRWASVYLFSPAENGLYLFSGSNYEDLATIDRKAGQLGGILEVPKFVLEGDHLIQVVLEDAVGNRILYGYQGDAPLPPGSPEVITVTESAGADVTPVIITDVTVNPEPVDITSGIQTVSIEISFVDDRSGLQSLSLSVRDPDEGWFDSIRLSPEDLISGTPLSGTLAAIVEIPQYIVPGEYPFSGLSITDQADNYFSDGIFPVFPVGMPSGITVVNNGPVETEPPEILSVDLPQTTFTISGERTLVPITVEARDDITGVDRMIIEYELPGDSDSDLTFFFSDFNLLFVDGLDVTYKTDGLLREFDRPGTYELSRVYVEDAFGLRRNYDVDDVASLPPGLPTAVTVFNEGPVDLEPPQYNDIRLSATEFDVTDAPGILELEIDFSDDMAGLDRVDIVLYNSDPIYRLHLLNFVRLSDPEVNLVSGDERSGTLRQLLKIPRFVAPGTYEIRYELSDGASRDNDLRGSRDEFPFPGRGEITVVNRGEVDFDPPSLLRLSFAESVDVTDGSNLFTFNAEFLDNLSGVARVFLGVESPSGIDQTNELVDLVPTLTEGSVPLTLKIPAFAEPGEWTVKVALTDANGRHISYDPVDLQRLGLPSTFTVINNRPPGYLWKGSDSTTRDGWREVDWFGWVQDQGDYPFVYHLEHGWIYTSGSDLEEFAFYELTKGIWWWISEENYPWMYANAGSGKSGWVYYYAPFGTPGNRWFYDPSTGQNVQEAGLFSD